MEDGGGGGTVAKTTSEDFVEGGHEGVGGGAAVEGIVRGEVTELGGGEVHAVGRVCC